MAYISADFWHIYKINQSGWVRLGFRDSVMIIFTISTAAVNCLVFPSQKKPSQKSPEFCNSQSRFIFNSKHLLY